MNLAQVEKITDEGDFQLAGGARVPIRRRRRKESEAAFFNYMLRKDT